MWRALDDLIAGSDDATGRLILETSTTETGTVRWLRVIGHKDIAETLAGLPMIHADATLPLDLVRNYLPNLKLACDLDIEAPHMRVTQVVGTPVGKAALVPKPPGERKGKQRGAWTETGEEAEERVARKRQRLVAACRHLAQGRRAGDLTELLVEEDPVVELAAPAMEIRPVDQVCDLRERLLEDGAVDRDPTAPSARALDDLDAAVFGRRPQVRGERDRERLDIDRVGVDRRGLDRRPARAGRDRPGLAADPRRTELAELPARRRVAQPAQIAPDADPGGLDRPDRPQVDRGAHMEVEPRRRPGRQIRIARWRLVGARRRPEARRLDRSVAQGDVVGHGDRPEGDP